MSKKETVEEFLKRGGTITKIPPVAPAEDSSNDHIVPTTNGGGTTMFTLGEGALYYSESKAKPKKLKKLDEVINKSALPASLLKYMSKN
jgi:hypothetical protein